MKNQIKGTFALLFATVIWGSAFTAQSIGMELIEPFTFQTVRCALAVPFLGLVIYFFDRQKTAKESYWNQWNNPKLWKAGIICGFALFIAAGLQQVGIVSTSAGKAGFLTAMYIVLVPILGMFLGNRPSAACWIGVAVAAVGLYCLSCADMGFLNFGDACLIGCAFFYAVQITLIDRLAGDLDGLRLNCIQCLFCSLFSAVIMFWQESPRWDLILDCWLPLAYAGIMSMGVAYSLQIIGQQNLSPTPASLLMSLESVFAALCGWLILQETMSARELLGCVLVFAAVIISQTPSKKELTHGTA